MVFQIGELVFGWGRILEDADGVWFDPPLPIPLSFGPSLRGLSGLCGWWVTIR